MFSKKINQKIAESRRHEDEQQHLQLTNEQLSKLHRRYENSRGESNYSSDTEDGNKPSSPPQQRSKSRIVAGFNTTQDQSQFSNNRDNNRQSTYSSRSPSNRKPIQNEEDEEEDPDLAHLQGSTNEIVEEFDVDNVELRYPMQGYLSGENLMDFNEESSSTIRQSPSSSGQRGQQQQGSSVGPDPGFQGTKPIPSKSKNSVDKSGSSKQKQPNYPNSNERSEDPEVINNYMGSSSTYFDTNFPPDDQYEPYVSRSRDRNPAGQGQIARPVQRAPRRGATGNGLEIPLPLIEQPQLTPPLLGTVENSLLNIRPNESNANYPQLSPNRSLNSNNVFFTLTTDERPGSNAASRDVIPLPIEIPDRVTDTDAFRRYLSVRRGASPFVSNGGNDDEMDGGDDDVAGLERSTLESLGRPGRRTSSQISTSEILATTATSSRIKSSPFQVPGSSVFSKQSISKGGPGEDGTKLQPSQQQQQSCAQASHYLKKTTSLSHAIMTLALLSASAAQLRFVVAYSHVHSYPTLNYFLICSCIIIEILVGIGFVILARFEFQESFVEKMHSYLIFGLFVVTIANVIVAAFALDDHICDSVIKKPGPAPPPPLTLDQQQQYAFDNQL